MADVTLSYKGSDILELSDSGSATLKTGGKYCEGDIEVEYVKPSGGSGNTLESDFLTIYKETVTVGENTISNSSQYNSYLNSIKSIPGDIIAMSIHKKNSYVYNEFANGEVASYARQGYRYRNGWALSSWNNSSYDAAAPVGTLVDIYTVKLKNPVNV